MLVGAGAVAGAAGVHVRRVSASWMRQCVCVGVSVRTAVSFSRDTPYMQSVLRGFFGDAGNAAPDAGASIGPAHFLRETMMYEWVVAPVIEQQESDAHHLTHSHRMRRGWLCTDDLPPTASSSASASASASAAASASASAVSRRAPGYAAIASLLRDHGVTEVQFDAYAPIRHPLVDLLSEWCTIVDTECFLAELADELRAQETQTHAATSSPPPPPQLQLSAEEAARLRDMEVYVVSRLAEGGAKPHAVSVTGDAAESVASVASGAAARQRAQQQILLLPEDINNPDGLLRGDAVRLMAAFTALDGVDEFRRNWVLGASLRDDSQMQVGSMPLGTLVDALVGEGNAGIDGLVLNPLHDYGLEMRWSYAALDAVHRALLRAA